jgi:hypothetical protein
MSAKATIQYEFLGKPVTANLTAGQVATMRAVAEYGPRFRDNICPRRLLRAASSTSLVRLGFLDKRTFPIIGYKLSSKGEALAAALKEL